MPIRAVVDKRSLEAWFDPRHACFIDVGFGWNALLVFDVQVIKPLAINERYPDLFGLGGVNQHLFHELIQLATQLAGAGHNDSNTPYADSIVDGA